MASTNSNFKRTKLACYSAYFTMSSVFTMPPLLFATFRSIYGISYTLLGTLILANFLTQLLIDLIFSIFSKKFNVKLVVKIMPLITSFGLIIFAIIPWLMPNSAYLGLIIGTVIFSVASGLSEVLLSPTIAAIPSDNPQREISLLHSLYAFGVITVIILTSLFIFVFDSSKWMYLALFFAVLPILTSVLFMFSPMPNMESENVVKSTDEGKKRTIGLILCFLCIFFGSCAEGAMTNWISNYTEKALGVNKTLGDILGMAMFATLLGLARILYAKFGKNICRVLLIGMIGAIVCYLVAGFISEIVISFIACILTGFFTSMLWPGTLIMMEEKIPSPSVAAFALMAAGGDLGAAVAPQIMGVVVDSVSASAFASDLSVKMAMSTEQIGLRAGMVFSSIFPIIGAVMVLITMMHFKKNPAKKTLNLSNN